MYRIIFLRLLRKLGFLKNRQVAFLLKVNDVTFTVPIDNEIGFNNHCMDELWMIELFKQFDISANGQILDVGANVGQTLLKWKSVYPSNSYIGIEPIPACHYYLQTLSKSNNFKDCTFLQKALFSSKGRKNLKFHFDDNTDRTATLVTSELAPLKSVEVDLIDFPTMVKEENIELEKVEIVKIDTEGSEVQILTSMIDFIVEQKPIILVEVLAETEKANERINAFNNLISKLPHRLYRIKKKGFYLDKIEEIEKINYPTKIIDSDYLLLPR